MNYENTLNTILARHGETEGNRKGIVQGQTDTPLTKEGIASTLRKADKLKNFTFNAVYCSDLSRATATMKLLEARDPKLPKARFNSDLREIDFGIYAGRAKNEIMSIIKHHKANPELRYPEGECGNDLIQRVRNFFSHCLRIHKGETILVVSHYGIMETAARQYAGIPVDEPVTIGRDDVWRLKFSDDKSARLEVL